MKITRPTPSSIFLITFVIGLLLTWIYPYHMSSYMDSSMVRLTGISLLLCSLVLNVLAYHEFKKSLTPYEPFMKPSKLIQDGIFSLSRNPVYLALILSQSGLAFVLDTIWLLVTTVILWILLDTIIVRDEENLLEMTFLNRYKNYKRKTRRWL